MPPWLVYATTGFPNEWPVWVRLIAVLEMLRHSRIVMAERLPTGEMVLMSEDVLERHVRVERNRDISLEDVRKLIREPAEIYDDGRPAESARGKYYAVRLKSDPYGTVKIKRLVAHLKRCKKLGLFEVSFVSTVILARKLPPQAKLRWKEILTK